MRRARRGRAGDRGHLRCAAGDVPARARPSARPGARSCTSSGSTSATASNVDVCRRAAVEAARGCSRRASRAPSSLPGWHLTVRLRSTPRRCSPASCSRSAPGRWRIYKPRWGAFHRTRLEEHLRETGVGHARLLRVQLPQLPAHLDLRGQRARLPGRARPRCPLRALRARRTRARRASACCCSRQRGAAAALRGVRAPNAPRCGRLADQQRLAVARDLRGVGDAHEHAVDAPVTRTTRLKRELVALRWRRIVPPASTPWPWVIRRMPTCVPSSAGVTVP